MERIACTAYAVQAYRLSELCIGHSNASDSSGFYLTRETTAKIFVDEVNDIPKLKDWLEKKDYSYSVVRIKDKKNRRVY